MTVLAPAEQTEYIDLVGQLGGLLGEGAVNFLAESNPDLGARLAAFRGAVSEARERDAKQRAEDAQMKAEQQRRDDEERSHHAGAVPVTVPAAQPPKPAAKPPTPPPPAGTVYKATKRERREFYQVANKFYDWPWKMPPLYQLVWGCLHRHANGRPGRQAKVATARIGRSCNLHRATVGQALRYLAYVGAIVVLAEPRRVMNGAGHFTWSAGRYYVPPVTTLDAGELAAKIATAPKELLKARPDLAKERARRAKTIDHPYVKCG